VSERITRTCLNRLEAGDHLAVRPGHRRTRIKRAGRSAVQVGPAVLAALDEGWTPQELAGFAGANTGGVRNPYAVLAVRLSAAGLSRPPGHRPSRPPWYGECDERTRRTGFHRHAPKPCPRCKPSARTQWDGPAQISHAGCLGLSLVQ
jgi:hypothetical protein